MREDIILVDEQDHEIGTMEKMEAHRKGVLHRAFSVLIFNSKGEMLLQKRSKTKYHSGGLWTNACCSHPRPDEPIHIATRQRLLYEMGVAVEPAYVFKFIYRAVLDNDLVENELDHVYAATFDGTPEVNADEVEEWRYVAMDRLYDHIKRSPEQYTAWFKLILDHPEFLNFSKQ